MQLAYAAGMCGREARVDVRAGKRAPGRLGCMGMAALALKQ